MKIVSAELLTSVPDLSLAPSHQLPEFPMVGRSNVGKSSLINLLTGRKALARTSNTPGKTRLMNFYVINGQFSLVDLPGYGYAKVSKTEREAWERNFRVYLTRREQIRVIFQLIDGRHGPQASDLEMYAWLRDQDLDVAVILTKIDKPNRSSLAKTVQLTTRSLKLNPDQLFTASVETGAGRDELLRFLRARLNS